jgi:DNA-binding NtrC family response regulator
MPVSNFSKLENTMQLPAKVLVVDDEAIVRQSCLRILALDGYEVTTASSASAALEMLRTKDFDVALIDLRMPASGGLSLLRAIGKISPQTEAIVITGYPSIANAKEATRLGAFAFIPKPVFPDMLRRIVSQVLTCKPWKIQERCFNGS